MSKGDIIKIEDFQFQRPCPKDAYNINDFSSALGKSLSRDILSGDYLKKNDFI